MADKRRGNEPPEQRKGSTPKNVTGPKRPYVKPEAIARGATEKGYSHALAKAVLDIESKDRNLQREHATVFRPDGSEVFNKGGDNSSVSFNFAEMMKMKDAILTHNHPNVAKSHWWGGVGSPFSKADIMAAVNCDLAEIRAVTPTYTFSIKRPKGGWGNLKKVEARYKALQTKYTKNENKYVADGKDYKTKSQRKDRAHLAKWHQIVRDLSKEFGWEYTKKKG